MSNASLEQAQTNLTLAYIVNYSATDYTSGKEIQNPTAAQVSQNIRNGLSYSRMTQNKQFSIVWGPAVLRDADSDGYAANITVVLQSKVTGQYSVVTSGTDFSPKTWDAWVKAEKATAVPGAVEFTQYAESKGVKVFYVTNRSADQEEPTRRNAQALGFPMGGNVDTFLMSKEKPEWGSAKSTRRATIAKDYRIVLLFGDNFGDFTDAANGSEAERMKAYESVKEHFGRDWLMLANPGYGSFESAPYGHNFKLSADEKRARKIGALEPWVAPAQ